MTYEELLEKTRESGLIVIEDDLSAHDGLIYENLIFIDKKIETSKGKACVLAEEIGHYYTATGDILNQKRTSNRKQELKGRIWAYNSQVGLIGIVNAYKASCRNIYEVAEFLNVTEEFLTDALEYYGNRYGMCAKIDNYIIYFQPSLGVMELM